MMCYCFLRNVQDILTDGNTAYRERFDTDYKGPQIPFGASCEYAPSSDQDRAKLHQFGTKVLPGVFMGYHQKAGGSWSGDLLVCDLDEIGEADNPRDIYIKRFKANEVIVNKVAGQFNFQPLYDVIIAEQPDLLE